MNRIPTEGLKLVLSLYCLDGVIGLNEQNPDRGIETSRCAFATYRRTSSLNEQNPDRGIETCSSSSLLSIGFGA